MGQLTNTSPTPQAPAITPTGMPDLSMMDLAALEEFSRNGDVLPPEGLPDGGDASLPGEADVSDPGASSEPAEDASQIQGSGNDEVLRLRAELEKAQNRAKETADRLKNYESEEEASRYTKLQSELVDAFARATPEVISEKYIELLRANQQLSEKVSTQVAQARMQARFETALEIEAKHDPMFPKRIEAMEATFGQEAVNGLFREAIKQQDQVEFIKLRLKNIVLPEEQAKATAEAATRAAEELAKKGKPPAVPPTTGAMQGKSPAPSLDVDSLVAQNLGGLSITDIEKHLSNLK